MHSFDLKTYIAEFFGRNSRSRLIIIPHNQWWRSQRQQRQTTLKIHYRNYTFYFHSILIGLPVVGFAVFLRLRNANAIRFVISFVSSLSLSVFLSCWEASEVSLAICDFPAKLHWLHCTAYNMICFVIHKYWFDSVWEMFAFCFVFAFFIVVVVVVVVDCCIKQQQQLWSYIHNDFFSEFSPLNSINFTKLQASQNEINRFLHCYVTFENTKNRSGRNGHANGEKVLFFFARRKSP